VTNMVHIAGRFWEMQKFARDGFLPPRAACSFSFWIAGQQQQPLVGAGTRAYRPYPCC
jgi:hypothetical protein